jgi:hypothetical protein
VIFYGIGQTSLGAHVVNLTVHCRWHPGPILYGRGTFDGVNCYALPVASQQSVESQQYVGNYAPPEDERRRVAAAGFGPDSFPVAKPKPGQPEHWHFLASCTHCPYHVRLGARDSQLVDFVKGLWVRRGPSLMFTNVGPFLEDLGHIGVDGLLRAYDDLGVERFVNAMNRNWDPESADPPVCRIT